MTDLDRDDLKASIVVLPFIVFLYWLFDVSALVIYVTLFAAVFCVLPAAFVGYGGVEWIQGRLARRRRMRSAAARRRSS